MYLADVILRIRSLFRRARLERELDEELQTHLELQTRKYVLEGRDRSEARRMARSDFGGVEQVREACRDVRGVQMIENLWKDLSYGFRTLRKTPGFTATAGLALAIGIGANVALLHSFLAVLQPILPFRNPDRIAVLWLKSQKEPLADEVVASIADLADWRARAHSFSAIAATTWTENMNVGGASQAERVRSFEVTANLFDALGVQPRFGRAFLVGEEQIGHNRVAILGSGFCLRHFGGSEAALGKPIRLDGETYSVVGVLPPGFSIGFLPDPDVLVPLPTNAPAALDRRQRVIFGLGRLRERVSLEDARKEMAGIEQQLGREHVEDEGWSANVNLLASEGTGDARAKLPFFAGIAAIILLLACTNAAALSLARYLSRQPEMVVRSALGAGRGRLVQQVLCEGLLLSTLAGALGFAIALGGIALLREYKPFNSNFPITATPDWRIFLYYGVLIGGVTLLFGSAPALMVSRSAAGPALSAGSPRIAGGRGRLAFFSMTFQIGVAVAALCVTGLMAKTLARLYDFDLGFRPERLIEGEVILKGPRYASRSAQRDFFERVLERIEADGRVRAAITSHFPLSQSYGMSGYAIQREDRPLPIDAVDRSMTGAEAVSPGFFLVAGAKLTRGRDFSAREEEPAAIVNETFARKYFPGEDPVGKRVLVLSAMMKEMDELTPGPRRIVGVVKDISPWGPRSPVIPDLYVPFDQNPVPWMSVVIERMGGASEGATLIRAAVANLDSDIPIFRIHTARELVDQTLAQSRFQLTMLGLFAAVALFLSGIGVFSVVTHSVRRRRREFGIRLALGATPGQIRRLAMGGGLALAGAGLLLGLGISTILGRTMTSLLFDVKPWDTQIACAAVLLVVASIAAACLLPAHEAARTDPMSAVREE